MTITVRTTFTINNGAETVRDLAVEAPSGSRPEDLNILDLMSLAADTLVAGGQVMVCDAEIITTPLPQAA